MTREEINRVVQWCRSEFRTDGAEGESVRALCDYIDKIHDGQDERAAILQDLKPTPCALHGEPYCDCDK